MGLAVGIAFAVAGTGYVLDFQLHQALRRRADQRPQKVSVIGFTNQGARVHLGRGKQAGHARAVLGAVPVSAGAQTLGTVGAADPGTVVLTTGIGGRRVIDLSSGKRLPRIC